MKGNKMLVQYAKNRLVLLLRSPQLLACGIFMLVSCGAALLPLRRMCVEP